MASLIAGRIGGAVARSMGIRSISTEATALVRDPTVAAKLEAALARPVERSTDASSATESEIEAHLELFRLHNSSLPLRGQTIRARVLDVSKTGVLVDTGFRLARLAPGEVRAESIIGRWRGAGDEAGPTDASPRRHTPERADVRVGDVLSATLESIETPEGEAMLRGVQELAGAKAAAAWAEIAAAHASGEPVQGRLLNRIPGGYAVGVGGIVAFAPSQHCSRSAARAVGVLRPWTVIGLEASRRNIVLADAGLAEELDRQLPAAARDGAAAAGAPGSAAGAAAATEAHRSRSARSPAAEVREAAHQVREALGDAARADGAAAAPADADSRA